MYPAPYEFRTLAGVGGVSAYVNGAAGEARFASPGGVAADSFGNIYVADTYNHVIRRIDGQGTVTLFAGSPNNRGSDDGVGESARFDQPAGIAVDGAGNVYVADTNNQTIRKIDPAGHVSTLAGSAGISGSTNGLAADARFGFPTGVAVDNVGNIFIADFGNQAIRKINVAGMVSTLAGNVPVQGYVDGPGTSAEFKYPYSVAVGASGNVYVADAGNHVIRMIDSGGVVSTYAGSSVDIGSGDGVGIAARFRAPSGIAVDRGGNLYVMDFEDNLIRQISPAKVVSTIAGLSLTSGSTDGIGDAARFTSAYGIAVDGDGSLYVADTGNHLIRTALRPATPSVPSPPMARALVYGETLSLTAGVAGSPAPSLQWQKDGSDIPGAVSASFTIPSAALTDSGDYRVVATNYLGSVVSPIASVAVGKATAAISLGDMSAIYDGNAHAATVTTNPGSLSVVLSYDNSSTLPIAAGSYTVVATIVDQNYQGSSTGILVIGKATASVAFSGLNPVYNGNPRSVTVTTTPALLPVALTYNGSSVPPTNAGSYAVVATVNDSNYAATATSTLVIEQAAAQVTLGGLTATYDGRTHPVSVVTVPAGLSVRTTYNGTPAEPVLAGTYAVSAIVEDTNYAASSSSSLIIAKAHPVLSWNSPSSVPFGTALSSVQLAAHADVGGTFIYSPLVGTILNAGTHFLTATFTPTDQVNYLQETIQTTLLIERATQTILFDPLANHDFGDAPFALQAQADPSGLPVTFTVMSGPASVAGNALSIFGPGLVTVRASQAGNSNFLPASPVDRTFRASPMVHGGIQVRGDFNGDGKPDLVWSNSVTGERALWLMNGTTFIGSSTLGVFPLEWTIAATADFNADGWPDIVWSNNITGERAIWLMDGTTFLGAATLGTFPLEWTVAATGDFNGDGKPDLVWSNSVTGERALWLMDGTNFLRAATLGIFPLEWTVAAVGDFNSDFNDDIIWSNSATGERAIWLMNGTNFLRSSTLGVFPLEWTVSGAADFNGDDKTDLIWSNSLTGERALWLMNGTNFLGVSTLGMFPLEWTVTN